MNNQKINRSRGFAAVYITLAATFLMPLVGLAIDLSIMYIVKAKLQAAVDAAAIGAGNMLQRTTDLGNLTTVNSIKDAAQRFYSANFPSGYWGTTPIYYDAVPSEDLAKVRTVYVHAAVRVPMLFLRLLRIDNGRVAAEATTKIRFVTMMVVVDRSGSVLRAGDDAVIRSALNDFVAYTPTTVPTGNSIFVDGRDIIGMISYGGTSKLDFAPVTSFRSSIPSIGTAISNIPFGNSATNTSEGLYQAYTQLQTLNQTGALNVIVLLTDGRPSAFTAVVNAQGTCTVKGDRTGFISANVGVTWPPLPPQTWGLQQGSSTIYSFGIFNPQYTGLDASYGDANQFAADSAGCHYATDGGQPIVGANLYLDATDFRATDAHGNSTTTGYYPGEGTSIGNPRAVRYASFNAADNMATRIRQDTAIRPVLFVIGLNQPPAGGELLDADWLARVANDPQYKDTNGNNVYQTGQTAGVYYNVSSSGLAGAFQDIASQILRLSQ